MAPYCTEVRLPECSVEHSLYGYTPSLPANTFLATWFAILFSPSIILGLHYRAWTYMLALGLSCTVEAIGYGGRVMLHNNIFDVVGTRMQICCLIIGPAFNSAAIYLILKHVTLTFGPEFSLIKPRWYTWIFISWDLLSLILQGIGGGIAATADNDRHRTDLGVHIMLAGICWQVATLLIFAAVSLQFFVKCSQAARNGQKFSNESKAILSDQKFKAFVFATISAFMAILLRCVYRIPELAGGWQNKIARDQTTFIIMEGAMIAYATLIQTLFHPGYFFPPLTGRGQDAHAGEASRRKAPLKSSNISKFGPVTGDCTISGENQTARWVLKVGGQFESN